MNSDSRYTQNALFRGFTLVELLIVIAIIAILVAMLFPVVGKMRTRAQERVCANNLKQWGAAMNLFLVESYGKFPSQGSAESVGAGGPESYAKHTNAWFNVLPKYIGARTMLDMWQKKEMPRPGDASPFICPSASSESTISATDGRTFYCNYPMNLWVEASTRGCSYGSPDPQFSEFIRLSQIPDLSVFPVLADGPTGTTDGTPGYRFAHTHAYYMGRINQEDGGAFRHGDRANIVFADGHADSFQKDEIYRDGMDQFWNVGGIQWNPSSSELDGPCDSN
ncbi:MAG: prepilin-type N-terminal cleavage/methylation domain-containing protein [Verrucomicrobia bacterium]|nr:prepilin-type N-terminal cleavage/methylation domain-containing protein [Verrucomicrobiota bacterium]